VCGQENIEPDESAWHLVTHFFNDITHFDGKFFSTLKLLIFKPGFLSTEYRIGRRASYLNPIRMYVFTSAIFFLIFFSLFQFDDMVEKNFTFGGKSMAAIDSMNDVQFAAFAKKNDSSKIYTKQELKKRIDSIENMGGLQFAKEYKSRKEYDSLLQKGVIKDGWFMKHLTHKQIEVSKKYNHNGNRLLNALIGIFMHNIPQMLFVMLPLFALFLKIIYHRSKKYYYSSHAIFSIHFYIFVFIVLLLQIFINKIEANTQWQWLSYISAWLYATIFFYEYKAMRNFYQQRRAKTVFKFILLNTWLIFIMVLLFTIFIFVSYLKV
jgi:hypothetical protein